MLNEIDPLLAVGVFVSALGVNYLGSLGIRRTAEGKAASAAAIDVATLGLNAMAVYAFVNFNVLYIVPEAIGCFVGSYIAIRKDCKRQGVTHK